MKQLSLASKTLSVVFAALVLAACSGTDTKDADAAAEAARLEAERVAQMEADRARAAADAEMQRIKDAAMRAGTVFYFEFDSSTLTREAQAALDANIALLKTTDTSVRLEGHTDERGTREYNMALGERRANTVRDYMTLNGIPSYRIESVSYGEEKPVAYGSGEANWSQNRRVELK